MSSSSDWEMPPCRPAQAGELRLQPRRGPDLAGGVARHHSRRRLYRRHARHRALRKRGADPRRRRAHHRLPDHRGGNGLAASRRWPRGARPRARLRPGDRLRTGAGAGAARIAGAADRPIKKRQGRRCRGRRRRRRTQALGGGAHRRQAGIRRQLGICPGRGDLHRAGAPVLGRDGDDRAAPASCSGSARCRSSRSAKPARPSRST